MAEPADDRTPAVGGQRSVPVPDPIARDYLLLALRLGQRIDGLVDGYFGPADLKAEAEIGSLPAPARLAEAAAALRARVSSQVGEPDRARWLDRQLVALEMLALGLTGHRPAYRDEVRRCFDAEPEAPSAGAFEAAAERLAGLLPGDHALSARVAAWDERFTIPLDRLPGIVDWLLPRLREASARHFPAPATESLRVSLVRDQPWGAYNWYDGGRASRVDINTDLPIRAADLVATLSHETFPGHHLEHASKEAHLVDRLGRLEASILLIDTPECYVSEGLAELGRRYAIDGAGEADLLEGVYRLAGLPGDRSTAQLQSAISAERHVLRGASARAALLLHDEHRPEDEVLAFVRRSALVPDATARKRLEFISHPLWRTYVFSYSGGEALLGAWCAAPDPLTGTADPVGRFRRLLSEQLTPSALAEDLAGVPAD